MSQWGHKSSSNHSRLWHRILVYLPAEAAAGISSWKVESDLLCCMLAWSCKKYNCRRWLQRSPWLLQHNNIVHCSYLDQLRTVTRSYWNLMLAQRNNVNKVELDTKVCIVNWDLRETTDWLMHIPYCTNTNVGRFSWNIEREKISVGTDGKRKDAIWERKRSEPRATDTKWKRGRELPDIRQWEM